MSVSLALPRRAKQALGIVVLTAALLPLGASPLLAATLVSHSGTIGTVKIKDTASKPGATCGYSGAAGTLYFDGITVRGPKVEFPDVTSGVDHGKVGMRVLLQHASGGAYTTFVTSPETKISVTDSAFSAFSNKHQAFTGAEPGGTWRAEVVLTWYNAGGSVRGAATYLINNHLRGFNGSVSSSCPAKHHNI